MMYVQFSISIATAATGVATSFAPPQSPLSASFAFADDTHVITFLVLTTAMTRRASTNSSVVALSILLVHGHQLLGVPPRRASDWVLSTCVS